MVIIYILIIVLIGGMVFIYTHTVHQRRNQMLRHYRNVMDQMPIVYIKYRLLKDHKGRISDYVIEEVNPSYEEHFGSRTSVIGRRGMELDNRDKLGSFLEVCGKVEQTKKEAYFSFYNEENKHSYDVMIMPSDIKESVDLFFIDVTDRVLIERELTEAKEKAEEASRLKSAFLANISHEIRTPLNAIVGFSGILMQTEDKEEKQKYMQIIETNNALLLRLVGDLLDLSQIEAGLLKYNYSDFDLNEMMRELEQVYQKKTDRVRVRFENCLPDCWIHTEKQRLLQVMTNLLNNAVKFTMLGEIRFGYRRERSFLRFHVSDSGCGIPPQEKRHIFDRFVKLNDFTQGVGLGLSICEMIVHRLEGEIGVESEVGRGAIFWFTIPYHPVIPCRGA